jgi:hypothetical protein
MPRSPIKWRGVFDWFKRAKKHNNDPLAAWRAAWIKAVEQDSSVGVNALREQLGQIAGPGEDVEVELEMLDGLEALRSLQHTVAGGALPVVETHHRVVGTDACHFTAPASLPVDESHASGRVLFTASRAIFIGGARPVSTAWHAVHEVLRSERDVLLVRPDHTPAAHFRFNTFGDAVAAAFLALQLRKTRTPRL